MQNSCLNIWWHKQVLGSDKWHFWVVFLILLWNNWLYRIQLNFFLIILLIRLYKGSEVITRIVRHGVHDQNISETMATTVLVSLEKEDVVELKCYGVYSDSRRHLTFSGVSHASTSCLFHSSFIRLRSRWLQHEFAWNSQWRKFWMAKGHSFWHDYS